LFGQPALVRHVRNRPAALALAGIVREAELAPEMAGRVRYAHGA
jgi:hypothetical protein